MYKMKIRRMNYYLDIVQITNYYGDEEPHCVSLILQSRNTELFFYRGTMYLSLPNKNPKILVMLKESSMFFTDITHLPGALSLIKAVVLFCTHNI